MKRVLLVGEHPYLTSGNGNMMQALLDQIDYKQYEVFVLAFSDPIFHFGLYLNKDHPYKLMPLFPAGSSIDPWRGDLLIQIADQFSFDVVVFVGIDVWRYAPQYQALDRVRTNRGTVFACITQYDLTFLRNDWISWLRFFDIPTLYSQYCLDMVKDVVPGAYYFRPPLVTPEVWIPRDEKSKAESLTKLNQSVPDDAFIFGFVGKNQYRKDPQRALKAFAEVRQQYENARFYLHTNVNDGVFNLRDYVDVLNLKGGDVFGSQQGAYYGPKEMVEIYHLFDCLVNTSLHEGLSWTLLEAMLCGVPVIATYTTAQKELIDGAGCAVACDEIAWVPVFTALGGSHVETRAANFASLVNSMKKVLRDDEYRNRLVDLGLKKAKEWLAGASNINNLLEDATSIYQQRTSKVANRENAVLFVQHSSAGDVLMSTQCFKGIKERHPDMPLVYMTQSKFADIVQENPYIDEIIDWDETKIRQYKIVYNPHGEKILPGGWNNLDATLYSLYPYFCKVEVGDMMISPLRPAEEIAEKLERETRPIIVVHTTGQVIHRMYKHMNMAVKNLDALIIQVGALEDYPVGTGLDLRGELSWRETAWIMSKATIACCVDSFPAHLAGALGIDSVVIFGPAPARVTQPRMQHGAKLIILESNKLDVCPITAGCWGQANKEVCSTPCINTISPWSVKKAIQQLLQSKEIVQ